jgi:murein DD-endopeptidase MepM/ murein hydrolase activator NlpD
MGLKFWAVIFYTLVLAAFGQAESIAQKQEQEAPKSIEVMSVQTYADDISCVGVFEQGGLVKCTTTPNAIIDSNGIKSKANKDGLVVIGFDRDAPASETISVILEDGVKLGSKDIFLAPRQYAISRIDGLPPSQVSTFTDKQLVRIRASSARKKKGFASREQTLWFKDGFSYPLKEFTKTSPFGAQRILNGVTKKPHYGVDIAAPVGTPIYAPADGVVSMADDDLYFEGAMVLIDHGQGLISMYLHMSALDVEPGQEVKRGEKIGEVGSKGRSTGPHLCWRLKWRNRHLDPELLTEWPADTTHESTHD